MGGSYRVLRPNFRGAWCLSERSAGELTPEIRRCRPGVLDLSAVCPIRVVGYRLANVRHGWLAACSHPPRVMAPSHSDGRGVDTDDCDEPKPIGNHPSLLHRDAMRLSKAIANHVTEEPKAPASQGDSPVSHAPDEEPRSAPHQPASG